MSNLILPGQIPPTKLITNASAMVKDLVQGDDTVAAREDFKAFNIAEVKEGLNLLLGSTEISDEVKKQLLMDSWRVNYRVRPPTPEEFLTSAWIGGQAESIYPHIRNIFMEFWKPNSPFRHLVLGMAVGTGKSTLSVLDNLYVSCNLWCMRNPKKFFGLAASTSLVQAFISFSMDKASQLLLQPFMQVLLTSPKFRRVKQEEHLEKRQRDYPNEVCWTTAGRMGAIQFPQDVHYILASGPHQLLGLNMIHATLSEISFFIDRGFSPDYIWRIYQDSKGRIQSRFGENKRFCGTILDSSPNDLDASPIDKYIFTGEAQKDPKNYVVTGSQWGLFEQDPELKRIRENYPRYAKTGETFPVYRGSSSSPAEILVPEVVHKYSKDDIFNVPIDLKSRFVENCTKNVKDFCGWPAGSQDKLIREHSLIEEVFSPQLKNFSTYIYAPSTVSAKNLIWDQVRDKFFVKIGPNRYEFYRSPREQRWLHFDQSETGDICGCVMSHPEWDMEKGEIVVVHDFTIAISPGKGRINLDAIRLFPEDLRDRGGLNIVSVTFDQYQSSTTIQYLKERGFEAERFSGADMDMRVYYTYVALINTGRVKAGRNIYLKNNLKSIQEVSTEKGKRKIDHMIGKIVKDDGGAWDMSMMGLNAKDISDCAAVTSFQILHGCEYVPRYTYKEVKASVEVLNNPLQRSEVTSEFKEQFRKSTMEGLRAKMGYQLKTLK